MLAMVWASGPRTMVMTKRGHRARSSTWELRKAKQAYLDASAPKPGRPGVSSLKLPEKQYRPSQLLEGFETKAACRSEDDARARFLAKVQHQGEWGDSARALGLNLARQTIRYPYPSSASWLFWRDFRQRLLGNLALLAEDVPIVRATFFTIIRHDWACFREELDALNVETFRRAIRKNICDNMSSDRPGFLIGFFEASYDPVHQCYQFHIHGVATDDYVYAVDALKGRRPFRPWQSASGVPDCQRPVENRPIDPTHLVRSLGYSIKGYWQMRNSGRTKRLQGDEHTRMLLFLHKHRPENLALLMGVQVKGGKLQLT